jgi:hypothetical protein
MKSFIAKAVLALTFAGSQVLAAGLAGGDTYKANYITGDISVRCSSAGQTDYASYRCRGSYLSPESWSKFVDDSGVNADKVKLTFRDHRNKKRTKSSSFKNGQSKKSFNLWVRTLTQRPLLNSGDNEISYSLTKGGNEVASGTFNVQVEDQPTRYCQYRSYYSNNMDDCRFPSNVCNQYFREQNACR